MGFLGRLFKNSDTTNAQQISKEFVQCNGNADLWRWLAKFSVTEVSGFCNSFSFESLDLSQKKLLADDDLDPRFQLLCFLISILLVYDKLLAEKPGLKLRPSLPASELVDVLTAKLVSFVGTQKTGDMALIYKEALVELGGQFMTADKDSEALECFLHSYPSPNENHYIGILGCRFNIAMSTKKKKDINAAMKAANKVLNGQVEAPPHGPGMAKDLLMKLRELHRDNRAGTS